MEGRSSANMLVGEAQRAELFPTWGSVTALLMGQLDLFLASVPESLI